jgi:long-chain fatty acid transport protein
MSASNHSEKDLAMRVALTTVALVLFLTIAASAHAQSFGTELHNTLMPASGGMAGTSIARPQDLTSALNANPAALTQFKGTQTIFGAAWAEPTVTMTQTSNIPIIGPNPQITPFSAKSEAPGVPAGNIGVTQEITGLGLPVTLGIGFVTTAGGFVDYRQVPASNGTNSGSAIFSTPISLGVQLTDRLSVGTTIAMVIAFYDGPFVGASGMTPDYALRGTLGVNYLLTESTTVGAYYQTEQSFLFNNAVIINPGPTQHAFDVRMDLPKNYGLGIANTSLCDGKLLLAADLVYKLWEQAALYDSVYNNQFVVQLGAQYTMGRAKLRLGYAWAEDPINQSPAVTIGGVTQPGGIPATRYTQGLLAITSQNRISAGIGITDVMPGMDLDLMAGGMLRDSEQLGPFTTTTIESYWVGMGTTWRR